jgi:transposase-like protein
MSAAMIAAAYIVGCLLSSPFRVGLPSFLSGRTVLNLRRSIGGMRNFMPRHYTPEDRDYALERLLANRGDVPHTADELGISPRTLYNWRQQAKLPVQTLPTLPPIAHISSPDDPKSLSVHGEGFREGLPTDDLQALRDLKDQMLRAAATLSRSIEEAIAEASLGQRVTALAQLTDRIVKLAAQLPSEDEDDWLEGTENEERDEDWDETEEAAYSSSYSRAGFE